MSILVGKAPIENENYFFLFYESNYAYLNILVTTNHSILIVMGGFSKKQDKEPANCGPPVSTVQLSGDPEVEVRKLIGTNYGTVFCTLDKRGTLKKWQLPPGTTRVQLRPRNGSTFYYHVTLELEP